MDIVKNLNYSADEINEILASVSAKASNSDLTSVRTDLNNLTTLFSEHAVTKTTLAEYGITDAKIENGVITIGSNTITPITLTDLDNAKAELMALITKLQDRLDLIDTPDRALVDSEGNIFTLKDGEYFITKDIS